MAIKRWQVHVGALSPYENEATMIVLAESEEGAIALARDEIRDRSENGKDLFNDTLITVIPDHRDDSPKVIWVHVEKPKKFLYWKADNKIVRMLAADVNPKGRRPISPEDIAYVEKKFQLSHDETKQLLRNLIEEYKKTKKFG